VLFRKGVSNKLTFFYGHTALFTQPTFNMGFQKGAFFHDEDSRHRGDDSFSDTSGGSKTTNGSSLATTVSDSQSTQVVELVAGRCAVRTKTRKYDDRVVIYTGPHTCKKSVDKEKQVNGDIGKPAFYVPVFNKCGKQNIGVKEDTAMDETVARERTWHAATHTPFIGMKACTGPHGILGEGEKAKP
jgi:hypothetical protein